MGMRVVFKFGRTASVAALLAATAFLSATHARSETIQGALARAYHANPELNAQRATTRAADESLPQALSGYRPKVTGSADVGIVDQNSHTAGRAYSHDRYPPRGHAQVHAGDGHVPFLVDRDDGDELSAFAVSFAATPLVDAPLRQCLVIHGNEAGDCP